MRTAKHIIRFFIYCCVKFCSLYLVYHASDAFIYYSFYHLEPSVSLQSLFKGDGDLYSFLAVELLPIPEKWTFFVKKKSDAYFKSIPKLFITTSIFCNLFCGNTSQIMIDFCWYLADILVEKIEHHREDIYKFLRLRQ